MPTEPVLNTPEDEIALYLQEVRTFPLLSAEEEKELAVKCATGDENALRKMVSSNLRLVISIAKEYTGRGVPLMDLVQEGSIGLLTAARKFDPSLNFRFSTYATKWIRQGVTRCLLSSKGMIRVPLHAAEKMRKVLLTKANLLQENGTEPTISELAEACEMPEDKVAQILQLNPEVSSLDTPVGEDDGTLGQLLSDLESPSPYEDLVHRELIRIIDELLSDLNERQQRILRLHYGLEDGTCYSLEQIGSMLGISKERARQIEHQAIDKLRKMGNDIGLEEFLE